MIISRTPYRISFFGGGTDYPAWYRQHGGAVLAMAINKYCYITCRYLPPFFEHRFRIVYSRSELVQSIDEIQHPAVRETLRYLGIRQGLEIHHDGDLPARSGIGSSSSFTVGLLHALYALKRQMPTKQQLAEEAIYIEQERIRETVGSQDQYLAAYGGLNHILFGPEGVRVQPVILPRERQEEFVNHLMLFYTGIKRTASDVAASYVQNLEARERQLRALQEMVAEAFQILTGNDELARFGKLLHEAWRLKRSLSTLVSNTAVDEIYEAGLAAGALGGKILGAGGGGFILFFVHPEDRPKVRERLDRLIHVPVALDHEGSRIIFMDPFADDYTEEAAWRLHHPVEDFRELKELTPERK